MVAPQSIRRALSPPTSFQSPSRPASGASNPARAETPIPGQSIERRGSALNANSVAERRARREQLREFYGVKGDKTGAVAEDGLAGPSSPAGTPADAQKENRRPSKQNGDPLDIDSPAFNTNAYYDDLVSKATLADLMKRASALGADVGNLQSSRHSLVYHHHHQLFAAGDTIAVLNTRTPQLISIVNSLQDSFSSISQLADAVALPESSESVRTGSAGNGEEEEAERSLRKDAQRLKLMTTAEEPVDRIRELWERIRPQLEEKSANDPARWAPLLDDVSAMIRSWEEANGQPPR